MSICMVEYQGRCDEALKAVGHSPKVLEEYYGYIKDLDKVSVLAPETILKDASLEIKEKSSTLPHYILMKSGNSFLEKIANKKYMFDNISNALKKSDADTLWFFNVEFYFWLYMAFHSTKKRIVVTSFIGGFGGGFVGKIKQRIFEKAQKRIALIIGSGKNFEFKNCVSSYIPDYVFQKEKYEKYLSVKKQKRAVVLGTMGSDKQLEQLIAQFSKINYPLLIAGRFYDKDWFEECKRKSTPNITVTDKYISDEEYLKLLSESEYAILPYSREKYGKQTSGVLQEAMFLNTVPVAFGEVLSASNVSGKSIEAYEELTDEFFNEPVAAYTEKLTERRDSDFSEAVIRDRYKQIFRNDMVHIKDVL